MCSVYSAVSGEVFAVVDPYEGKSGKEMKQILADLLDSVQISAEAVIGRWVPPNSGQGD